MDRIICIGRIASLYRGKIKKRENIMWTTPEYSDMRFGFEVTMYICNR